MPLQPRILQMLRPSLLTIFKELWIGFNARIGKWETEFDVWREVREVHGIGTCKEAREQLLELCAVNNLTIMNNT